MSIRSIFSLIAVSLFSTASAAEYLNAPPYELTCGRYEVTISEGHVPGKVPTFHMVLKTDEKIESRSVRLTIKPPTALTQFAPDPTNHPEYKVSTISLDEVEEVGFDGLGHYLKLTIDRTSGKNVRQWTLSDQTPIDCEEK